MSDTSQLLLGALAGSAGPALLALAGFWWRDRGRIVVQTNENTENIRMLTSLVKEQADSTKEIARELKAIRLGLAEKNIIVRVEP